MYSKTKCHDENRLNLGMYSKAKWHDENQWNLVMYSKAKWHDENQSNLVIYSKAKCYDENRPNLVMNKKTRCTICKTRASVSSGYPNTEKQMCFYCFEVFGYPDETRSTSFGNKLLLITLKEMINEDFQLELFAI